MFWIGLIVGIAIVIALFVFVFNVWLRMYFKTPDEYWNACGMLYDATQNRECEIRLMYDGEVQDSVVFEEMD